MKKLEGRIAVVTGAAGGIGRATAVALADAGCDLAISDVKAEGLEQTAGEIEARGRKVSRHVVDVADRAAMEAFVEAVVAEHGAVHVLVNNAGVTIIAPFRETSLENFEWILGVNLWGVIHGCKLFLPHLEQQDEAHIVNISSLFGIIGTPYQSAYCATKFAVRGFSESLRIELADSGVGVTSVHPGAIATDIVASSRIPGDRPEAIRAKIQRAFDRDGIPPEAVAKRIVRAVKGNQARILVETSAHVGDIAKRIAPSTTQRLVGRIQRRLGLGQ